MARARYTTDWYLTDRWSHAIDYRVTRSSVPDANDLLHGPTGWLAMVGVSQLVPLLAAVEAAAPTWPAVSGSCHRHMPQRGTDPADGADGGVAGWREERFCARGLPDECPSWLEPSWRVGSDEIRAIRSRGAPVGLRVVAAESCARFIRRQLGLVSCEPSCLRQMTEQT